MNKLNNLHNLTSIKKIIIILVIPKCTKIVIYGVAANSIWRQHVVYANTAHFGHHMEETVVRCVHVHLHNVNFISYFFSTIFIFINFSLPISCCSIYFRAAMRKANM